MSNKQKNELIKFGKKLTECGFVYSFFGNMSVLSGDNLIITKRESMLDELTEEDLIEVSIESISDLDKVASSELPMHRAIYQNTNAGAIIHAHSFFGIVESILTKEDKIVPIDKESKMFFKDIPIIEGEAGSLEFALNCADTLRTGYKGLIAKEHGSVVIGKDLKEAFLITSAIEQSCKIKYYCNQSKQV